MHTLLFLFLILVLSLPGAAWAAPEVEIYFTGDSHGYYDPCPS